MSDHSHKSHPAIVKRLRHAEGHIRGIAGMIEAGQPRQNRPFDDFCAITS